MDAQLERQRFGLRLRTIRKSKGLTLAGVAESADMTASALSQIERGISGATVETVVRIAGALGVSTGSLFSEEEWSPKPLLAADRISMTGALGYTQEVLTRRPNASFEVFEVHYPPGVGDATEPYRHGDSEELLLIVEGRMELILNGERVVLAKGDSIELQTSHPHMVTNIGDSPSTALWVISPPTSGRRGRNGKNGDPHTDAPAQRRSSTPKKPRKQTPAATE